MVGRTARVSWAILLALLVGACTGSAVPTTAPTSDAPTVADTLAPAVTVTPPPTAGTTDLPGTSASVGPTIDPSALAAALTSSLSVWDLTDADVALTVNFVDPDGGQTTALGTYTLEASEQFSNGVPPGRYRFDFRDPATSAAGASCTIEVPDQGTVTFTVVPGAVAVTQTGFTPAKAGDLFVATSPVCKP